MAESMREPGPAIPESENSQQTEAGGFPEWLPGGGAQVPFGSF